MLPSKMPSWLWMLTSRMLMLKSPLTTFARSSRMPMRSMPRSSMVTRYDMALCCDHLISSLTMFLPNCAASLSSSSQLALCTMMLPVAGSRYPTTLSPGIGLQHSAISNWGSAAGSFSGAVSPGAVASSPSSSSFLLMNSVQNLRILLLELTFRTFSRLSRLTIPAPILLYSSSLLLLS